MGLPRFYVDSPLAAHTSVALSEAVTRHVHVLRLAVGDEVCLFDGSGHEYRARLDAIDRRSPTPRRATPSRSRKALPAATRWTG
jgi:16S rRNA (uracil1498-N3)-methyltransferase